MNDFEYLKPTKGECKYHIVFIPKCRRKTLYGTLRRQLGGFFRELAEHKEGRIEEGHWMLDHVPRLVSIPPQHSVSQIVGYLKGKSAIHIARTCLGKPRNFLGEHFWARGYFVSTVGKDEKQVREYIKQQEQEDQRIDQLRMFK
jgi:putative transposase